MALSDLELLELVERAQDERQGPIGPQGVGIRSIEQPTADAVIIALTDGRTKELRLTAGPKGDPGEAGKPGQDGKPGPAGSPGRAGAAGVGVAGAPGRDGTSIDTAIVNADGNLLLGLTDGNVLNVGRVVGPPGATGAAGPTGLPGRAGRDGNTILSGTHAPSDDEGSEGDFWIDTSSPLFDFYGKGSSGWRKLTSLRAPQTNVGGKMTPVAGGGAGGGGGGGGVDLPPVIIDKDPPAKGNNQGPVRQGDLWFDSDQLALYVATKDASNQIVWVISIPGVTGVPSTQTASAPVVYPKAVDGDEYVNPITNVTYRYNEPKKQWINVNGGIVSVQDKAPLTPQTGSLWFDTEDDDLTLYIYTGSEWVSASPPVSLDGIEASIANVDAELMKVNANIAMNKRDIDEAMLDVQEDQAKQDERLDALEAQDQDGGDYLPTAGGELKGTLQINGSMDEKIDPLLCRADGYYMTFGVTKTGEVLAGSSPGLPFLAVDNWHVVTKGYLDSRLPEQGLFHETWWTFRASADRSDCGKGEFCADGSDFFMSDKNEDNNSWGPSVSGGRNTQAFVTIYSSDGKLCHTYEVNKIHFHEKYTKKYITEFDWTWSHVSNALVDGAKYKIVVPGFLT
nr:hypothetical protein [uncultured Mediterranean phage uvMED]